MGRGENWSPTLSPGEPSHLEVGKRKRSKQGEWEGEATEEAGKLCQKLKHVNKGAITVSDAAGRLRKLNFER